MGAPMKQTRSAMAIIFGTVVLFSAVVCIVTLHLTPSGPVYDESGKQLESLFAGISPDWDARESVLEDRETARRSPASCGQESAILAHLASWMSPSSVYAASCGSSSCSGHFMRSEHRRCSTGCNSSGWYRFYYSSPQLAPWQNGWKYTGGSTCGDCDICVESGCQNW